MTDIKTLEKAVGLVFKNRSLLTQALSHSSYVNENNSQFGLSNERLEFLGDAVLGLIVTQHLYLNHPSQTEGDLSRMRSSIIRRETLAKVAQSIELGNYLLMGKGEGKSGGSRKTANLAGAMEAFIGAVFLEFGMEQVTKFVEKHFSQEIYLAQNSLKSLDSKSHLQELVQSRGKDAPIYHVIDEAGPSHRKSFKVEVIVDGQVLSKGEGLSKKDAEEKAAANFLKSIDK